MSEQSTAEQGYCTICGKALINTTSIDMWASLTMYDEFGEPYKIGEQVPPDFTSLDYIVIGMCCKSTALALWRDLTVKVRAFARLKEAAQAVQQHQEQTKP